MYDSEVSRNHGLTGINNRFNLGLDRGNDPGVRRNRLLMTGVYQLPFGRGKHFLTKCGRAVDALLGEWQLSIALAQTGPYLTPYDSNTDTSQAKLNQTARAAVVRPDRFGNCNLPNPGGNGWFNLAASTATPAGAGRPGPSRSGNLRRSRNCHHRGRTRQDLFPDRDSPAP